MKINWGTGIVIAFALFISFILYFVFKVQSNAKYDNELVVEEYYKHDAKFGDEMIRAENAQDLKLKPIITVAAEAISIVFPNTFIPKKIKGKVSLYRPSNKNLDFEIPISLTNTTLLIPKKSLVGGRWDINMEWQYDGKSYLTKEIVYIK
ncbi:cytochrome Cbb3 oxidase maturation protein CcoH [Flavobacterium psychrophilum]|uniref:Probable cytochrome cbb3 oxidase maturation protein CcoH n=1 Tax=Flavobacterium psychrophilum (strain ATCC 49511 / DSM 21280 / CIP 103535 / JIP02/86) TaxID=402612 RepID=A6GYS4_FLAPJ|nr:FixH family protein [Flavobacterium psychrophilum]AIG29959.1 cytochrome Cbb3 oxidase maturation protein CcoH [Flavobacterium psychrophilum]AIG32236.1 cytochrome Cbb3 oxidase maturation protein CcoH [Flavobacterium psychrophilum]AIG34392.1 cytochrome Cbb3 oxidase maturation protein CcoH [Flavobacterium psychrophilum]AIG36755.1 cytochrome Cbb3 oxidase maturation protein CcoH [Flavobacterium psychrophilum]AIG39019.1 cytochrome Cbb3 oxidase maturation protein CcoH [Flavobacterium psychrophilum]